MGSHGPTTGVAERAHGMLPGDDGAFRAGQQHRSGGLPEQRKRDNKSIS